MTQIYQKYLGSQLLFWLFNFTTKMIEIVFKGIERGVFSNMSW